MLSEEEIQELKEMAASETLREEFRTMRLNSQGIARRIGVDELAHWLTVMARVCAGAGKTRRPILDSDMRL
jgi:hypothetical protein